MKIPAEINGKQNLGYRKVKFYWKNNMFLKPHVSVSNSPNSNMRTRLLHT
jgi:hypothetical protein